MARKPEKLEDPEQSKRFLEAAREVEAAGGLGPTEAAESFDRAMKAAAPERQPDSPILKRPRVSDAE